MKSLVSRAIIVKISLFICLFTVVLAPLAGAVTGVYDESFYAGNDILFYNPQASSCPAGGSSSSAGSLTGNTNAEKIWNWFKGQGLSSEQAAGVMGNLQAEGGFSPTRQEDSQAWPSGGWGLVQWTGGRRTAIASSLAKQPGLSTYYDNKYGAAVPAAGGGRDPGVPVPINIQLLDFELNYMMQESQGRKVSQTVASQGYGTAGASEWTTLKQQKTIEAATVFWHNNFEVSAMSAADVISVRGGNAKAAFTSFSGSSATSSGPSSQAATACPTSFTTGNLSETVKAYAWPDYHAGPFVQKMPAYQTAITKAKADGRFVGSDGIDCGGFVTTLIVDSGFDPTYNSSGKGGATGAQKTWLDAHWNNLGKGNTIDPATLQPGDVAMLTDHTFVYVGKIAGFNSVIASSSLNDRAPMAGKESLIDANVTWYRKKG